MITILHIVCENSGRFSRDTAVFLLNFFLNNGADINTLDNEGLSPLGYLTSDQNENSLPMVKILIEAGANINLGKDIYHFCYHPDWSEDIIRYLIENGSKMGRCIMYVLSEACENEGKEDFIGFLMEHRQDEGVYCERDSDESEVDESDYDTKEELGELLISCVNMEKYSYAKILIEKGADIQELMLHFVMEENYHCDQIMKILSSMDATVTLEDFDGNPVDIIDDSKEYYLRVYGDGEDVDWDYRYMGLSVKHQKKWFKHIERNKWDGKSLRVRLICEESRDD